MILIIVGFLYLFVGITISIATADNNGEMHPGTLCFWPIWLLAGLVNLIYRGVKDLFLTIKSWNWK